MDLPLIFLGLALIANAHISNALPVGGNAIGSHCKDMVPAHGGMPQTSPAPYTITTDIPAAGYTPGVSYTVTVEATNATVYPTHGFIAQFRNYNNLTTRGVFTAWDTNISTTADCDRLQDTITHYNPSKVDLPSLINVTWMAPAAGAGPLRIWSSFVRNFATYWVLGFISAEFQETGGAVMTTSPTPTEVTIDLTACNRTKGCFVWPATCRSQSNCTYIYTQRVVTVGGVDQIEVELSTNTGGWAAIGYSQDRMMVGADTSPPDDVLACQQTTSSGGVAKNGYLTSTLPNNLRFQVNDNTSAPGEGLTNIATSFVNGVLSCRFRRNLYTGSMFDKDLRQSFYHFYAWGIAPGGDLNALSQHGTTPRISAVVLRANDTMSNIDLSGSSAGQLAWTWSLLLSSFLIAALI